MIRQIEKFLSHTWWIILFIIFSTFLFEQGMKKRDREYTKLQEQYLELEKQTSDALAIKKKLLLEINSQSDPSWVELMLMKRLGLIPEGQVKVFFDQKTKGVGDFSLP